MRIISRFSFAELSKHLFYYILRGTLLEVVSAS